MDGVNLSWILSEIVKPLVDLLLLAFLLYKLYSILEETKGIQLIKGAVLISTLYSLVYFLDLKTMVWLMNFLGPGIIVGLAIVFQPELRSIFTHLGRRSFLRGKEQSQTLQIEEVLKAAQMVASRKRGMLVVFPRNVGLRSFVETGTSLNADLSDALLISIFCYPTPLHDGAVILNGDKIEAAGCFLPLSNQRDVARDFGTRHRAALGMAEESDAITLIVSEETQALSLAHDSSLLYNLSPQETATRLRKLLLPAPRLKRKKIDSRRAAP